MGRVSLRHLQSKTDRRERLIYLRALPCETTPPCRRWGNIVLFVRRQERAGCFRGDELRVMQCNAMQCKAPPESRLTWPAPNRLHRYLDTVHNTCPNAHSSAPATDTLVLPTGIQFKSASLQPTMGRPVGASRTRNCPS